MSTRYLSPAFETGLGPVGGPAELEVNAVLTTSGHLTLRAGQIAYEPGLDARLLGRGPLVIPVADVTAVSCRDGHRRVVLRVGEQEFVLRGVGAQRVWMALTVLRDERPGAPHQAPLVFEEEPGGDDDRNGLYGIGARGYGYAGRLPVGIVISYWEELSTLRSIRSEGGLVVRGAEERSIHGAGAATFVAALIDRWLEVPPRTRAATGGGRGSRGTTRARRSSAPSASTRRGWSSRRSAARPGCSRPAAGAPSPGRARRTRAASTSRTTAGPSTSAPSTPRAW